MVTLIAIITTFAIIGSNMDNVYAHVSYVLAEDEMNKILLHYPNIEVQALGMLISFVLMGTLLLTILHFKDRSFVINISDTMSKKFSDYVPVILRLSAGVFLIFSGIFGEVGILSTDQHFIDQDTMIFLNYIQMGIGIMFLVGLIVRVAALGLLALFLSTFLAYGMHGIDQFMLLGISLVMFFEGCGIHSIDKYVAIKSTKLKKVGERLLKVKPWSMLLLRITLGITLIWLGITEKILAPDLFIAVIENYQLPYIMNIELFVFAAGMIEILIGAFYLLGIFNRSISVLFFGILIMTTLTFGENIIAHIFLFAVALCFIIRGGGPLRAEPILKYQ